MDGWADNRRSLPTVEADGSTQRTWGTPEVDDPTTEADGSILGLMFCFLTGSDVLTGVDWV